MAVALSRQDSEINCYRSDEFAKIAGPGVGHGFFGRRGGVSRGVYASLNTGYGSDDEREKVGANFAAVEAHIGARPGRIVCLHQVHGVGCVTVRDPWTPAENPEADAFVTDVPGLALGIRTADCAPVLLAGRGANGPVIGAAHAGWKGALGGVLESAVRAMRELNAREISACIGPCIGPASYEVNEDFAAPFLKQDEDNERFFRAARKSGHLMFDLAGYCASRLAGGGVKQVFIKDLDTYFHEEDFFSYRRSVHRGEADYGRQLSVVMIG